MLDVGVCVFLSFFSIVDFWSPAGKELTSWLAVVFVVYCHFPKYVPVHIRIKGEVGAVKWV